MGTAAQRILGVIRNIFFYAGSIVYAHAKVRGVFLHFCFIFYLFFLIKYCFRADTLWYTHLFYCVLVGMCVYMWAHACHGTRGGQRTACSSRFPPCGSQGLTQVIRLGSKFPKPANPPEQPLLFLFISCVFKCVHVSV